MGEFAFPSDRPFVTTKKELKNRPLTEEEKARKAFIRSHNFSIEVDDETDECKIIVTEKKIKND